MLLTRSTCLGGRSAIGPVHWVTARCERRRQTMGIERTGGPTLPPGLPSEQAREVRRAVVCERDELTRRSITGILAEDGFEVVGDTAEPADAVGLIRDRRPDVVVAGIAPGSADLLALAEITALRIAPV